MNDNPLPQQSESDPGQSAHSSHDVRIPSYLVGLGASAGGLESLEKFFMQMPFDSGMAFVIIQHLSPDFKTMMDELLARRTSMSIRLAQNNMLVEADSVYLLPPKKDMIISEGRLLLTDRENFQELSLPIDHFFRSLAQDAGRHAIGIILSGTGSDGSRGIAHIKNAGGLVLCEDPQIAKFDGMPKSAMQSGFVDYVLAAQEIPQRLIDYQRSDGDNNREIVAPVLEGMEIIFDLLRSEYDIDFSHYKPATVTRRIERRLSITESADLDKYIDRLRQNRTELLALYEDLLIGVTRFFRDRECFEQMEREFLPRLIKNADGKDPLRIWVAGCATGEEAYSLAILLHERMQLLDRSFDVKIFATDVHPTSLAFASAGIYDEERLADVSTRRLARYFEKKNNGYHIAPELRQMVLFAPHNIIKDAPFTKLDLIACRNLLIYLQPQFQKKALSLFHFGLKHGGLLFLGPSETPGALRMEFDVLDEHCKIYQKSRDVRLPADLRLAPPGRISGPKPSPLRSPTVASQDSSLLSTYDRLLDRFMPPALLVDESYLLIDSFSGAERFLQINARRPSSDILDLLAVTPKAAVTGSIRRAFKERKTVRFAGVQSDHEPDAKTYHLTVEPVADEKTATLHFLIIFKLLDEASAETPVETPAENPVPLASPLDMAAHNNDQILALDEELRYTKENLQATIEELETSNEELQGTNQELIASNEELQASNEELNSVNEELYTVNTEYQNKINQLRELNEDMNHLLASTDVGTVFLDNDLRIRRYTPRISGIFDLQPHDIGRQLTSFAHKLDYGQLLDKLAMVLRSGTAFEHEVRSHEGQYFLLRILPYRVEDRIDGAVLTLTNIGTLEKTRARLRELSAIVESSQDAIIGKAEDGTITSWNEGAERIYGYTAEQAVGKNITFIAPEDKYQEISDYLGRIWNNEHVPWFETLRQHRDGALLNVSVTVSPVKDSDGRIIGASAIERDITLQKQSEQQLFVSEQKYQDLYNHAPDMYLSVDVGGQIRECNDTLLFQLGYQRDELLGKSVFVLYAPEARSVAQEYFRKFQIDGGINDAELQVRRKDGSTIDVSLNATAVRDSTGHIVSSRSVWRDITERKLIEKELRQAITQRERFLAILSHELRNPLNALYNATAILNNNTIDAQTEAQTRRLIERQTAHMARLLDDLLDVSRITQNKLELRKQTIDVVTILKDAVAVMKPLFDQRHIDLHIDLQDDPDQPLRMHGDAVRLQQVYTNLLNNAVKYSDAGSTVWLSLLHENGNAVIKVRDDGIGIDPHILAHIFDLFVQSDNTLDRSSGGMGVGLTLVKLIVEMHGGEVSARSEGEGKGSEFTVRLPLDNIAGDEMTTTARRSVKSPVRVLVVEDIEDSRVALKMLLELKGYKVSSAADGRQGLQMIGQERPDIALIDIGLPVMDGYQLAEQAKKIDSRQQTYLVAVTGYGQPADVEQAYAAGFDDHVVKPLDTEKLAGLFDKWRQSH